MTDTKTASRSDQQQPPVTPDPVTNQRRYVTEFIGTAFLVFVVGCAVLTKAELAPLAIGAALAASVYAGGHLSGAHYNPAVSLAALIRGRLEPSAVIGYWIAQLLGGAAASALALFVVNPAPRHPVTLSGHALASAFVAELVITFVLAYTVLNVATSMDHPHNSFYGLAIGFTVLAGAVAVGGVSGGAFNPAVALGESLIGLFAWSNIWIYLCACLLGGASAGYAFRWLNPEDK